ncbi:MAG: hypothetical protein WBF89_07500 [Steroidobacteraceae bacterium]
MQALIAPILRGLQPTRTLGDPPDPAACKVNDSLHLSRLDGRQFMIVDCRCEAAMQNPIGHERHTDGRHSSMPSPHRLSFALRVDVDDEQGTRRPASQSAKISQHGRRHLSRVIQ